MGNQTYTSSNIPQSTNQKVVDGYGKIVSTQFTKSNTINNISPQQPSNDNNKNPYNQYPSINNNLSPNITNPKVFPQEMDNNLSQPIIPSKQYVGSKLNILFVNML